MDYTIAAAAARAGVSESTVRAARTAGVFKTARLDEARGKRVPRWLISGEELDEAGFVAVSRDASSPAGGPVFIEHRLMHLAVQIAEVLEILVERDADCAERLERDAATASALGDLLAASGRISAQVETAERAITSLAAALESIRVSVGAAGQRSVTGRWRRILSALRA